MRNLCRSLVLALALTGSLVLIGLVVACSGNSSGNSGEATAEASASPTTQAAVAVPAHPIAAQKGKAYKVGQAVRDPATGAVLLVNVIRYDTTSPGVNNGYEWALIDLTVGNAGTKPFTMRVSGDFGVKVDDTRGFDGTSPFAERDLGKAMGSTALSNTELAPGQAVHGMLPISVPLGNQRLALWYAPGLLVNSTPARATVIRIAFRP